ncbi:MAG: hypothetical protein QM723_15410 [Myxococcaceae bacterium]
MGVNGTSGSSQSHSSSSHASHSSHSSHASHSHSSHASHASRASHASHHSHASKSHHSQHAKSHHKDSFTAHKSAKTHKTGTVNKTGLPAGCDTVQGCANYLLHSPNVSFWNGLSTGSDRANMQRLANGQQATVPATGRQVTPSLNMMQSLATMAANGPVQINALTGGVHSANSNHYQGTAVDLDTHVGSTAQIVSIANQYGGARNYERDHIHLNF